MADNKERAKEMLKEEVQAFFNNFNERFCDSEDKDEWGYDHELDFANAEDFRMMSIIFLMITKLNALQR